MNALMKRLGGAMLAVIFISGTYPTHALAAIIGTDQSIAAQHAAQRVDQLQSLLARNDVARGLEKLGVDPVQARIRVATLTETELKHFDDALDSLPAGAGALEVIGIVFLVLLILELVGVTNIFNKI